MQPFIAKKYFVPLLFVCALVFLGCRPSVQEAAKVAAKIPTGASRDEVRMIFVEAYSKKFSDKVDKQGYMLSEPPLPLTSGIIEAEKKLITVHKRERKYVHIYPLDLFEKLSDKCFCDGISLVAEASDSNGSLTIYYDNHTNYVGFIAESQYAKEEQ